MAEDSVRARRMNVFDPYGDYQGTKLNGGVYKDKDKGQFIVDDPLSLNLYSYCHSNPVRYVDANGNSPIQAIFAVLGSIIGWALGDYIAKGLGLSGWQYWAMRSAVTIGGFILGWFAGAALALIAKEFLAANPEWLAKLPNYVLKFFGITPQVAQIGTNFGKLGTLIANPGIIVDWSRTTLHGLQRMAERGVTQKMVDLWVRTGKALLQAGGQILYITKDGAVVVNQFGQVITAYTSKYFDANMLEILKQLFG